jgi:hypothetical protein
MTSEPRTQHDYGQRDVEAARRVLVDLGQVLGSWFADSIVVVGGWVPDLLLPNTEEPHVGSIDVDLALDADKLRGGRYAEIVRSLLATGRYEKTDQQYKLRAAVDLNDGGPTVVVEIDFLKAPRRRRSGKGERFILGFRPLDADGCAAAFLRPEHVPIEGQMISGAQNSVSLLVASVPDFLVMKAHALAGRDKPKDAYDFCFCLNYAHGGMEPIARVWRERSGDPLVAAAIEHLKVKFATVASYGPQQVAVFYEATSREERDSHSRRAYELVSRFLALVAT